MAKFKYYIIDLLNGTIRGTNSDKVAENYATSEDNFVVEAETGLWLMSEGETSEVKEI